jgi:hypothetical protein
MVVFLYWCGCQPKCPAGGQAMAARLVKVITEIHPHPFKEEKNEDK